MKNPRRREVAGLRFLDQLEIEADQHLRKSLKNPQVSQVADFCKCEVDSFIWYDVDYLFFENRDGGTNRKATCI